MDRFRNIKNNSERIISNQFTKFKEFKYSQTNGFVSENILYTIYYTDDKQKLYFHGVLLKVLVNMKCILEKEKIIMKELELVVLN